jgi:hypothetical protein
VEIFSYCRFKPTFSFQCPSSFVLFPDTSSLEVMLLFQLTLYSSSLLASLTANFPLLILLPLFLMFLFYFLAPFTVLNRNPEKIQEIS